MKIAYIGHKQIPSREGGVEVVVEQLALRMTSRGVDVTCYNRKRSASDVKSPKTFSYKGVRIRSVWTLNRKGLAAMTASVSAAFCAAFGKFDIVHFHAEGPCAMLWLPKLFGKHCVATIHGLDHKRAKWGKFARAYIKFGEKCAVKFADEIIVLSKNLQQYFKTVYHRDTVLIPNGVESLTPMPADLIKIQFGLEKDGYLLFLGRLVPEKGISYLIQAYRVLHTDKKLVIAGASSDSDAFVKELRELAKEDERILFTGFAEGDLLCELYSNAYLYVLPSDLEGMPLTLLEAMRFGNCCVVSDIPECTEVAGEQAVVFRQGNVEDLRDKLQTLCDDPLLCEKFRAGVSDFVTKRYSWDDVTERTMALYTSVLQRKDRGEFHENIAGQ